MRLVWLGLLLATSAFAQQPPFRVHLLSLYHLQQVAIVPSGETFVRRQGNGDRQPLRGPLAISAQSELVNVGGTTSAAVFLDGTFTISGDSTRPIHLHVPVEISAHDGELRVIGLFPTEDYVAAVLQGETAGDMPPEALNALAVAIRSYATHFRDRHKEEGFDFCDTTHCQYLRTDISPMVKAAAERTANELLWDRGSPLAAYYHKDCGGRTEDVAAIWPDQKSPALISHEDPYCTRISKPWRSELSRADINRALASASLQVPPTWDRITIGERTPSGRARTLNFIVGNSQQHTTVAASSFRFALGRGLGWNTLKSDSYEVSSAGDHVIFTGRGTGHGVGLCQTGATEMAKEGKTYREILAFYYPGAVIGSSAQAISWTTAHEAEFDIRSVNAADATSVADDAKTGLAWAKQQTGLSAGRPTIDVYPTVAMFRNSTGEPGWVAADTRGDHIRIQPPDVLKDRLPALLRHELLHLLVESNAKPDTPLWFREGLVLYLSGENGKPVTAQMTPSQIDDAIQSRRSEKEVKQAYAAAAALVQRLDQQHGRAQVMTWLRTGLPADLLAVPADKVAQ
jgi:stage II sporulation protein D